MPETPAKGSLSKRKLSIFFSKTTVPKKREFEGNESADEDGDDAVEISKKTIKKIQKNKKHQKTLKKFNKNGHIALTTVVAMFKRTVVVMMTMRLKRLKVLDMAR